MKNVLQRYKKLGQTMIQKVKVDDSHTPPHRSRRQLHDAIKDSNEVLATANTVFSMFPDTVTIDRAKFTVNKKSVFNSGEIISLRIEDILNASATIGPFFGTLKIYSRIINGESYDIGPLRRSDALKLKRIAQGYVIALQREIDCNSLGSEELADLLGQLGEDSHDTSKAAA